MVGRPKASGAPLTQLALAQIRLPGAVSHPPAPLQVVWQLAVVQASCGSDPAATGQHVPSFPGTLQALQPLQLAAVAPQQTPSTQLPLAHSFAPPQLTPDAFLGTQLGATQ